MDIKEGGLYTFTYRSVREESIVGKFVGIQIIGSLTILKVEYSNDKKVTSYLNINGSNLITVEPYGA